ncbi:MAG: hypothetical protein GY805_28730, partial [Chloroflexi bacterium]|nr:hypothetical protein [Chloroflexota bacterium]
MDIRNILSLMWRRLWLMGIVALLVGTAVYLGMSRSGAIPRYSATAVVAIGGDIYQQDIQDATYLNLVESMMSDLLHLAQLEIVTGAVAQRLNLTDTPKAIAEMLEVSQIEGSNLISIQATHKEPAMAAAIANEVAQQLRQFSPSRWRNFVLVVETATSPTNANSTAVLPVILAAFTAALFTISLNFLFVYLRQPFYDERDVAEMLALPTLLSLPPIPQAWWRALRGKLLTMSCTSAWSLKVVCEQFLATNGTEDSPQSVLVVSPEDSFSHAFVATQLAMAWADSGQKTMLVDMDITRADISTQLLNDQVVVGFSSFLKQPTANLKS